MIDIVEREYLFTIIFADFNVMLMRNKAEVYFSGTTPLQTATGTQYNNYHRMMYILYTVCLQLYTVRHVKKEAEALWTQWRESNQTADGKCSIIQLMETPMTFAIILLSVEIYKKTSVICLAGSK